MTGVRVIEVAEHTFVPVASAVLADWGADVIKIEHVERGDAMRALGSTGVMNLGTDGVHVLLEHSNRGKRSIGLNLATDEGQAVFDKLLETADVLLTNKVPAVLEKLKLTPERVRAVNPKVIFVRGTGYGPQGPDANRGGYDILGYWARSGVGSGGQQANFDFPAMQPGPAYGDSIGGMNIAGGIAAALFHRERTGEAAVVDVSLLGSGMWAMGAAIALSDQLGIAWQQPPKGSIRNPLTQPYETADGKWLWLSCLQGFAYWAEACQLLGIPELATDERFNSHQALAANAGAAGDAVAAAFKSQPMDHWKQVLAAFSGQWAPFQNTLEIAEDPQALANVYVQQLTAPNGAKYKLVATPVQFDGPGEPSRIAPDFSEHGDAILTEDLGIDWDEVVELKLKGVVR